MIVVQAYTVCHTLIYMLMMTLFVAQALDYRLADCIMQAIGSIRERKCSRNDKTCPKMKLQVSLQRLHSSSVIHTHLHLDHTHAFPCLMQPRVSSIFTLKQINVTTEGTDQGLNFALHSAVFSFCLCLCNQTYRCETSYYYVTLYSFHFQLERGVSAPEAKVRLALS